MDDTLVGKAKALIERGRKLISPLRVALAEFEVAAEEMERPASSDPEVLAEERRYLETVLEMRRRKLTDQVTAIEKELRAPAGDHG